MYALNRILLYIIMSNINKEIFSIHILPVKVVKPRKNILQKTFQNFRNLKPECSFQKPQNIK